MAQCAARTKGPRAVKLALRTRIQPQCFTYVFSSAAHAVLSFATDIQFRPESCSPANCSSESSHLFVGRPTARCPDGHQRRARFVQRRSSIRATCPAHFHFRRRCSKTQSATPLSSLIFSVSWVALIMYVTQSSNPSAFLSSFCLTTWTTFLNILLRATFKLLSRSTVMVQQQLP